MRERSFGPTVLLGLTGGILAAVSGSRDWVQLAPGDRDDPVAQAFWENSPGIAQVPLAGALGLVVLACWGVVLVSRGRWRRVVAVFGLLAAIGLAASWITGLATLHGQVEDQFAQAGVPDPSLVWTSWFWVAAPACLLCLGTALVAVLRVPRWPAMGSRYDAPSAAAAPPSVPLAEQDPIEVWKALDEGRDPTRDQAP